MSRLREWRSLMATVDLQAQTITGPDCGDVDCEMDPFEEHCLLKSLGGIGRSMERVSSIDALEAMRKPNTPWLAAG